MRSWSLAPVEFGTRRLPAPIHPGQLRQYDVGTREERREAGDRYVDAQPSAFALYGLGRSRLMAGLLPDAEQRFTQAAELRPDLPWGEYGLALLNVTRMGEPLASAAAREASRDLALQHLRAAEATAGATGLPSATDPLLAPLQDAPSK